MLGMFLDLPFTGLLFDWSIKPDSKTKISLALEDETIEDRLPLSWLTARTGGSFSAAARYFNESPALRRSAQKMMILNKEKLRRGEAWYEDVKRDIAAAFLQGPNCPRNFLFEHWFDKAWEALDSNASECKSLRTCFDWGRLQKIMSQPSSRSVLAKLLKLRKMIGRTGLLLADHELYSLALEATEETPFDSDFANFYSEVVPALCKKSGAHFGGWVEYPNSSRALPWPRVKPPRRMRYSRVDRMMSSLQGIGRALDNILYVPLERGLLNMDWRNGLSCDVRVLGNRKSQKYRTTVAVLEDQAYYWQENGDWVDECGKLLTADELHEARSKVRGLWLKREKEVISYSERAIFKYCRHKHALRPCLSGLEQYWSKLDLAFENLEKLAEADFHMLNKTVMDIQDVWFRDIFGDWLLLARRRPTHSLRDAWREFRDIFIKAERRCLFALLVELQRTLTAFSICLDPLMLYRHVERDHPTVGADWSSLHKHVLSRVQHRDFSPLGQWLVDGKKKPYISITVPSSGVKLTVRQLLRSLPSVVQPTDKLCYVDIEREPGCLGVCLTSELWCDLPTPLQANQPYRVVAVVVGPQILRRGRRKWRAPGGKAVSYAELVGVLEGEVNGLWLEAIEAPAGVAPAVGREVAVEFPSRCI